MSAREGLREAAWQEYKRENTIPGYDRPSREEFMFGWQRALESLPAYPRDEDPFIVLGPELFTDTSEDVLCWKGVNYVRQEVTGPLETHDAACLISVEPS